MDIALIGYGRMGHEIEAVAEQRGHRICARFDEDHPVMSSELNADVAIDFSTASALFKNVSICLDRGCAMVVGTTGWSADKPALKTLIEQSQASLIYSSNFSVGMQIFQRVVSHSAKLIDAAPDYDIMLHEWHHKRKADSPSGTALTLAEFILAEVQRKTRLETQPVQGLIDASALHVSSTRGGEIAGTHTVVIDSLADSIELTHRAKNRSGFAVGSVLAAEWIVRHPGFHDYSEVFEQIMQKA